VASSAISVKYFDMDKLIQWLTTYKYAVLFPLAIVEGPVLAVVVGWLCSAGLMRIGIAYPIIIAGDIVSDSACYLLGRLTARGRPGKLARRMGITSERMVRWQTWLRDNPIKTISLSKITLGIGPAGIFMAGRAQIPYGRFLPICIGTSAVQYFFYLLAGLLLGHGYLILTRYLNIAGALIIAAAIAGFVLLLTRSYLKRL
jgi:membrane-associated protein